MAKKSLVYDILRFCPMTDEAPVRVGTATAMALAQTLSRFDRWRSPQQREAGYIHMRGNARISRFMKNAGKKRVTRRKR